MAPHRPRSGRKQLALAMRRAVHAASTAKDTARRIKSLGPFRGLGGPVAPFTLFLVLGSFSNPKKGAYHVVSGV